MNYLQNLQAALDFYRRNGGGQGPRPIPGYERFGQSGEIVPGLTWAQNAASQMGGGDDAPNFFEGDAPRNVLAPYEAPQLSARAPEADREEEFPIYARSPVARRRPERNSIHRQVGDYVANVLRGR